VVAVDFSRAGLMVLKRKMHAESRVALVQADVTRPYAAARAFDRLLSTLHSNLPGTDARGRAIDLARQALSSRGCAVISMHHYNIRNLLLREPAVGRYRDSGIVRYFLTQRESVRELSPFFAQVEYRFIAPHVPLIPSVGLARACASARGLRSAFGELFLAIASEPRPRIEAGASLVPSA
jgi:hypothetical protein